MKRTFRTAVLAAATALFTSAVMAAAGDPPTSSMDLGNLIPKSPNAVAAATATTTSPAAKTGTTPGAVPPAATVVGAKAVGAKPGVGVGAVLPGGAKPAQAAQDEPASSSDVVVKMPSNMKK